MKPPGDEWPEVFALITRPESRKGKLEVHFSHPTVHWEKTYKNEKGEVERGRAQREAIQDALDEARWYAEQDEDAYSETKSEHSALIHRM